MLHAVLDRTDHEAANHPHVTHRLLPCFNPSSSTQEAVQVLWPAAGIRYEKKHCRRGFSWQSEGESIRSDQAECAPASHPSVPRVSVRHVRVSLLYFYGRLNTAPCGTAAPLPPWGHVMPSMRSPGSALPATRNRSSNASFPLASSKRAINTRVFIAW